MGRRVFLGMMAGVSVAVGLIGCEQETSAPRQQEASRPPRPSRESPALRPKPHPPAAPSGSLVSPEDVANLRKAAEDLLGFSRKMPFALPAKKGELKQLSQQVAANPDYERQAPREAAIIYRLMAAAYLSRADLNFGSAARDASPWLTRAIQVDPNVKDLVELQAAQRFLSEMVTGKSGESVEARKFFGHVFRIAMVEATSEQIQSQIAIVIAVANAVHTPRAKGGTSVKDDFDYLWDYGKKGKTIGTFMETLKIAVRATFPGKDIDGRPIPMPLPNGNTKVICVIDGGERATFEWEVSKAKGLIIPKTKHAEAMTALVKKQMTGEAPAKE